MDFIKLETAFDLREFLNGQSAKDLRTTYLHKRDDVTQLDHDVRGVVIRVGVLTDGSETVDYVFK